MHGTRTLQSRRTKLCRLPSRHMVNLKRLLLEEESKLNITIDDVETLLSSRWVSRDAVSLLKTLDAFYYSEKEEEQGWAKDYITLLNRVMEHVVGIAKRL